jgi:hypothetical protein
MIRCEINLGLWGSSKDLQRAIDKSNTVSEGFLLHAKWIEYAVTRLEEILSEVEKGTVFVADAERDKLLLAVEPSVFELWKNYEGLRVIAERNSEYLGTSDDGKPVFAVKLPTR